MKSGDHILQIGSVNVRGMTSEQVALILRQCGVHVRLIVARGVDEVVQLPRPLAPVVRTTEVDAELDRINQLLAAEQREYLATAVSAEGVSPQTNNAPLVTSALTSSVEKLQVWLEASLCLSLSLSLYGRVCVCLFFPVCMYVPVSFPNSCIYASVHVCHFLIYVCLYVAVCKFLCPSVPVCF